jgi:hypothetical protein
MSFLKQYSVPLNVVDHYKATAQAAIRSGEIDKSMVRLIQVINTIPGMATTFCCSGHSKTKGQGYLVMVFAEGAAETVSMFLQYMMKVCVEHPLEVSFGFSANTVPQENTDFDPKHCQLRFNWNNYTQLCEIYENVFRLRVQKELGNWIREEHDRKNAMGGFGVYN